MRSLAIVAMCAGCNALLGVHDFAQTDAPVTPDATAHVLCSPISMLAGDFSTTTFTDLWNINTANYTVSGSGLAITVKQPTTLTSIAYYDIREGSFAISIGGAPGVDLELSSQTPGSRAGFRIANGMLELHRVLGSVDTIVASLTYDPTADKFLRFRVGGGQLTYETSPDGAAFTTQGMADAGALTFVQVQINFPHGAGDFTTTLSESTTAAGEACPIDEIADDFSAGDALDLWARSGASGGGSVQIVDGAAQLVFTTDNAANSMTLVASTVYDLRRSALTLEIPQMVDVATSQRFSVIARSRAANTAVEFRQANGMLTAHVLRATDMNVSTNAYDPIAMRWWRLHAALTSVSWEVSPDGNAWTQLAEVMALDGLDTMEISIGAQGMATAPTVAIVDNVGGL